MNRLLPIACLASLAICASMPAFAQRSILKQFEQEFVELSEDVRPSVVEISASGRISDEERQQLNDLFRFFEQRENSPDDEGGDEVEPEEELETPPHPEIPERTPRSTASGFIIDKQGHIVTNNHVVKGADKLSVELWDGSEHPATIVGQDPEADIAVIKIDPAGVDLKPVRLGNSADLKVGQFAIAMGSPSGLTGSFSYGHITGLGRESLELADRELRFQEFIQTDAAINLGNSGGPLCNIDGEVIGINVAIVYRANSIGFSIPVDRIKDVVPQLIAKGRVIRGWLGVSVNDVAKVAADERQELADFIEAHQLPDEHGSYVLDLTPSGPAEKGALQVDDVIRQINGKKIERSTDLINTISGIAPGDSAKISLWRQGKPMQFEIVVGEFPGRTAAIFGRDYLGMHITELQLRPEFMESRGLKEQPSDFFVVDVVAGSPAEEAGIRRDDIVTEVAFEPVKTREEFLAALREKAKPGTHLLMKVWTLAEKEPRKVYLKIPEGFSVD